MDPLDSKDFLEQLRTVHFTLLAVCLTVVVIVSSPGPTRITKAIDQLSRILAVKDKWDPKWLQTSAEELSKQHAECNPAPDQDSLYMKWGGQKYKVVVSRRWDLQYEAPEMKSPDGINLPLLSAPDTLRSFKSFWDSKGKLSCSKGTPARTGDRVLLWDPAFHKFVPPQNQPVLDAESFVPSPSEKPNLRPKEFVWVLTEKLPSGKDEGIGERPPNALIQINDKYPWQWSILTTAGQTDFGDLEVRSQIIKAFPNLQPNAFDAAFPELDQVAEQQQAFDLGFERLKKSLDLQEGTAKESFEVFGIKFPIEATTRWAVLLILSIQAYLLLHLSEYRRRGFKQTDVAWIGIYTSRAAKAVSALTMLIIPVSVILLLCILQGLVPLNPVPNLILSILVCIISTFLAVLTAYTLRLVNTGSEKLT
jgi:hypothetical protein